MPTASLDDVTGQSASLADIETDVGHPVRVMAYGPVVGEHHHDAMYGPDGKALQPFDVAVSPNLLEKYPLGSWIKVAGKDRRVADVSYFSPGRPTHDTVEIRDAGDQGYGEITRSEFTSALESEIATKPKLAGKATLESVEAAQEPSATNTASLADIQDRAIIPDPKPANSWGDWLHKTFGGIHLASDQEFRERLASPEDIQHVKYAMELAQKPLPYSKEVAKAVVNSNPAIAELNAISKLIPNTAIGKSFGGVVEGVENIAASLASPSNIALLATGVGEGGMAAKGMAAVFFGMAASRFPTQLKQFNATDDYAVKARLLTEMAAGLGLPLLGLKGGGKYAERIREDAGQVQERGAIIEGGEVKGGANLERKTQEQSSDAQAQVEEVNRGLSALDIRAAADRHKALLDEGHKLGAQMELMRKMGVPVPATISDRMQAINTELRQGIQVEDSVPTRNETTGATTKPAETSPLAPVDPPNTNPQVGKVGRAIRDFRNWWERVWARSWAVLRNQPDSPVITEHARLLQKPLDYMYNFTKQSWYKGLRQMGDQEIVSAESRVVTKYRQLKEAGDPNAWETAVSEAPAPLQEYLRFRKQRQEIENQASDMLEVPREDFVDDPYVPRITKKDMSDIINLHPRMTSWTGQIREGIASFGKSRTHATMEDGLRNSVEYESPLKAIWRREEFSVRLEATANMLRALKEKGVLFKTLDEAMAANPYNKGGEPMKLTGFGGRDYWVRSRQEGISLEQNLSPRGTSGALGRIVHMANLFSRDPNFVNPLPHTTKNMAFKYILARVTSPIFRRDVAEFKTDIPMRQRFEDVMPFSEHGQRMDQLRAWEIGNWAEKAGALPGKLLGYSREFIFSKADPAMRYSLWKSYVRKGMSDQEAANHVWIDLIRYDENSGALNFWRSIPFNFFATWRSGSFITLAKSAARAPIRTALFIGAVDYMREVIYRRTGQWTHLPHDYLEAPLMEAITGGPKKAAGVAATALIFGPGGGQAPSTIQHAMEAVQGDPEQRSRLVNMFWGMSFITNTPAEMKKFEQDGDPSHLGKILANFAFGTHSALKYEPRRVMKYMPDWLPGMQKSQIVEEAERLRTKVETRKEKTRATIERRHGIGAALEYTPEEEQIQSLRRAAGEARSNKLLTRPRRPRRQHVPLGQ